MVVFNPDKCGVFPLDQGDITAIDTGIIKHVEDGTMQQMWKRTKEMLAVVFPSGIIESNVSCEETTKAISNSL